MAVTATRVSLTRFVARTGLREKAEPRSHPCDLMVAGSPKHLPEVDAPQASLRSVERAPVDLPGPFPVGPEFRDLPGAR